MKWFKTCLSTASHLLHNGNKKQRRVQACRAAKQISKVPKALPIGRVNSFLKVAVPSPATRSAGSGHCSSIDCTRAGSRMFSSRQERARACPVCSCNARPRKGARASRVPAADHSAVSAHPAGEAAVWENHTAAHATHTKGPKGTHEASITTTHDPQRDCTKMMMIITPPPYPHHRKMTKSVAIRCMTLVNFWNLLLKA